LAYQIGPSLIALRLSLLPACPSRDQVCLHPSCSPRQHGPSAQSRRPPARLKHRHASDMRRSTPRVLAPVRVMLSRAINAYSTRSAPLAGTAQLHRTATYMCCLRCAGAPRRPASGSALSSVDPSQHVIPYVPGEPPAACIQFLRGAHLPSPGSLRLGTPNVSDFGAYWFTIATTC
jgi:hypothetical protein